MKSLYLATAGALVAGLLTTVPTGPVSAATKVCDGPKVTWRISLWGKRRAVTEGLEHFSKAAHDATCGNFNFKLYYGEQLSKSKENLDSIKVAAIDGGFVCASYHPQKVRALGVLDLPFLPVQDLDVLRKVHEALHATKAFKDALGKWDAMHYVSTILPQYEYMGRGKPPTKLEDFKGMRLRALGGMGAAATAIGAVPTTMPAVEVYNALSRGTIDAVGFPFSYTFHAYKLDEISDWYTTNLNLGTPNCFVALNRQSYAKLPAAYRKLLDEGKDDQYRILKETYAAKDKVNFAAWAKQGKMKAIKFAQKDVEAFIAKGGRPVWDAWVRDNKAEVPEAQELLDLALKTAHDAASMAMKK